MPLIYLFIFLTYTLEIFSMDVDPETGERIMTQNLEIRSINYPKPSSGSNGKPRS